MNKVISLKGLKFKKNRGFVSHSKRNVDVPRDEASFYYKLIITLFSLLFVLFGAFGYSKINAEKINAHLNNFIKIIQSENFFEILKLMLTFEIIAVFLCLILGTSLLGTVLSSAVPLSKTFLSGVIISFMYSNYELNGVLFSLLFIVPYFALSSTLLIAIANQSYSLSKSLLNCILQRKTAKNNTLRLFLWRFILLSSLDLLLVIPEILLLVKFGGNISLH